MPKILIMQSLKAKKDRKCETSLANMKVLIEKRVEKDPEDTEYLVVTLNTRMTLPVVRDLMNKPFKKLRELEGVQTVEKVVIDPSKQRGKWTITTAKGAD